MQAITASITTRLVELAKNIAKCEDLRSTKNYALRKAFLEADELCKELEEDTVEASEFVPVGGNICVVGLHSTQNIWRVAAIAKNWPMSQHPIAVGDTVVLGTIGWYGYHNYLGAVRWATPKEVVAIKRNNP